jgi:HlyD family secretion protein
MSQTTDNKSESLENRTSDAGLVRLKLQPRTQAVSTELAEVAIDLRRQFRRSRSLRKWLIRLGILLAVGLVIGFFIWRSRRPTIVTLVQPKLTTITESIASSGRVGGATETLVGSQAQGVVKQLYVKEGDTVAAGQNLALLKNDVAAAQAAQAEQAVQTARAVVLQTARGPLSSEVDAASERVRQAEAQVTQQQAAISQAQKSVTQARAQINQLKAERDLAARQFERSRALVADGVVPQAEYDQARANLRVADERVAAQQQAIELAQANVQQTQAGLKAAQANLRAQQASLQTVRSGARSEDVQVARQRLREAEEAVRVAKQQVENSVVTAPFAGVVTQINAELGQTVGTQGVLKLISGESEIRLDVDESNLADLKLGQTAIISSSTFTNSTFEAQVTEIGAAVDVARGTIQVTVTPTRPPDWLRPGQTVNVNIVTAKNAQRLLVPATALTRVGDRTVVFVIENGMALEKPVVTRPPTPEGVPVLAGLSPEDQIIVDGGSIKAGDAVRVKAKGDE